MLARFREHARKYFHEIVGRQKGLVFDIGANVGELTQVLADIGMEVVACEPDPSNFRELNARFAGQSKVHCLELALGEKAGETNLFSSRQHGGCLSTLSSKRKTALEADQASGKGITFSSGLKIETKTLDQLIGQFGVPLLIKIDVEGYEEQVLSGLSRMVPFICFESNLPDFREETRRCLEKIYALDPEVSFNASDNETSLLLENYFTYPEFLSWFDQQSGAGFDIICKAGNRPQ